MTLSILSLIMLKNPVSSSQFAVSISASRQSCESQCEAKIDANEAKPEHGLAVNGSFYISLLSEHFRKWLVLHFLSL